MIVPTEDNHIGQSIHEWTAWNLFRKICNPKTLQLFHSVMPSWKFSKIWQLPIRCYITLLGISIPWVKPRPRSCCVYMNQRSQKQSSYFLVFGWITSLKSQLEELYFKRNSSTGVYLWILLIFSKQLFDGHLRTNAHIKAYLKHPKTFFFFCHKICCITIRRKVLLNMNLLYVFLNSTLIV